MKFLLAPCLCLAIPALPVHAIGYIDVLPGSHDVLITRVTYEVDGEIYVQEMSALDVAVSRNSPVFLKSVTVNHHGTPLILDRFNLEGATVANLGFTSSTRGVGVFRNGQMITTNDPGAFATALAATTQDTDLMHYTYYDYVTRMPAPGVADYDLLFHRGYASDDYLLVSERWGNTYFTLTPLDAGGQVITGANTLRFGYPTGDAYSKYDWNSGFAASSYWDDQAMAFSVAPVSAFFDGSGAQEQTVYGFRVDNDGEADVKFFGLSSEPFDENPPLVPEPSSALLALMSSAFLLLHRKREPAGCGCGSKVI